MKIILEGVPLSQARMKYTARGGFARAYDPRAKEKIVIRQKIQEIFGIREKILHPKISFVFFMPIPKSTTKTKKRHYELCKIRHEKKPDVDNIIKLYLDCMTGIVFEDDAAVSLGNSLKIYSASPQTVILIHQLTEEFHALEDLQNPEMLHLFV